MYNFDGPMSAIYDEENIITFLLKVMFKNIIISLVIYLFGCSAAHQLQNNYKPYEVVELQNNGSLSLKYIKLMLY